MAKVEIKVKPEILNWALSQTSEGQLDEELMDHVEAWINGTCPGMDESVSTGFWL